MYENRINLSNFLFSGYLSSTFVYALHDHAQLQLHILAPVCIDSIVAIIYYMFYPSKFVSISFYLTLSLLSFSSCISLLQTHTISYTHIYIYTVLEDFFSINRRFHKKKIMQYIIWRNEKDKRIFEFCNNMVYIIASTKFSI